LADVVTQRDPAVRGGFAFKEDVIHLILWETSTGKSRKLSEDETGIVWLGFSPDGKKCVSTGGPITKVWDTATGKLLWDVPNYNAEETHFTPDSKYLIAAPGGGQNEWRIWKADTGKRARDLHPPKGYVWMFAVSPDGQSLLLPTETDYVLWDIKNARERHRWPGAIQSGRGVFAADGQSIVTHDTILRRWDIKTGKNLYADVSTQGHVAPIRKMFFAPDGKRLISIADDRTARVWDVVSSKLSRTIRIEVENVDAWAIAPDATALVGVDQRLVAHRWSLSDENAKSSINLREAQMLDIGYRALEVQLTRDGTLAMLGMPRTPEYQLLQFSFSFWDAATGKHIRWGGDPGRDFRFEYSRMSPDGFLVASGDGLYDTRTGLKRTLPASPIGAGGTPMFSPDGRLLAASSNGIRVWETASGRVLTDLPRGSGGSDQLAIAHDGRRLACLGSEKLKVWDLWTNQIVVEIPSTNPVLLERPWLSGGIAFSPDGRALAVGYSDGTILLWNVPPPSSESKWTDADLAPLWNDLGDESPANAYPSVWQLASRPADAVRMLRAKYPLVEAASPDEWKKLIAALDSQRFVERESATKRLRELGRASVAPLRKALDDKPSPEQFQRIESLLTELDQPAGRPQGEDLRVIRAVAVLEACGTDDARRMLTEWAERGMTPRLAYESAKAADRLRFRK
jgi:WD40 repeat protein